MTLSDAMLATAYRYEKQQDIAYIAQNLTYFSTIPTDINCQAMQLQQQQPQQQQQQQQHHHHQWHIKDDILPVIYTHDAFDMWPNGYRQMAYSAENSDARGHQSGWAMRNTNNHDPNRLKKSCLGVMMCSMNCRQIQPNGQASMVHIRPFICDKARLKQIGSPCPKKGCTGVLEQRKCGGHAGKPVTHIWRTFNQTVYFQSKGEHDHPAPEPKTSASSRKQTAASASAASSQQVALPCQSYNHRSGAIRKSNRRHDFPGMRRKRFGASPKALMATEEITACVKRKVYELPPSTVSSLNRSTYHSQSLAWNSKKMESTAVHPAEVFPILTKFSNKTEFVPANQHHPPHSIGYKLQNDPMFVDGSTFGANYPPIYNPLPANLMNNPGNSLQILTSSTRSMTSNIYPNYGTNSEADLAFVSDYDADIAMKPFQEYSFQGQPILETRTDYSNWRGSCLSQPSADTDPGQPPFRNDYHHQQQQIPDPQKLRYGTNNCNLLTTNNNYCYNYN